ncbi:MAG: hypothetical protein MSC31_11805 [Solirubrobacteraceae bacterium MAG38_C4-C5]|nr:hypothetical protein [Candidatus Siliceabacter maunaloa]
MLTVGITLMVASVVVGVITLVSVALISSPSRSAGRRARTAVTRSGAGNDPSNRDVFGSVEQDVRSQPAEAQEPPRWVLALALLSAAGLVLGLLLVMIPSIP